MHLQSGASALNCVMGARVISFLLSRYRRWSLRGRLVLLVIAAIAPLLVFSLLRAADQAQQELKQARASLELAVSLAATSQERIAESAKVLLTAIISLPNVLDGQRFNCDAYFDALRGRFPAYGNFGLIDRDGYTRCHALDSTRPGFAGDRSYFKMAVATRACVSAVRTVPVCVVSGRVILRSSTMVRTSFSAISIDQAMSSGKVSPWRTTTFRRRGFAPSYDSSTS